MRVPIANIGEGQLVDVQQSSGVVLYSDVGRICTVVKNPCNHTSGDTSPWRMYKELYRTGRDWMSYNHQYSIQVAGCPLNCWYCYVDNLEANHMMSASDIVDDFEELRAKAKEQHKWVEVNVLHFMGGCPGRYCEMWKLLRRELDTRGLDRIVLFSDVIFLEEHFYGVKPWEHMQISGFLLAGCLKGWDRESFAGITGHELYCTAYSEMAHYWEFRNFYLTVVGWSGHDLRQIYSHVPKERVDVLELKMHEVVKRRLAQGDSVEYPPVFS